MKIRIIRTEAMTMNHNLAGLKVKPLFAFGRYLNHNQGGLKVKQQMNQAITFNHNQSGLSVKPQLTRAMTLNHNHGGLKVRPQIAEVMTANHNQGGLRIKPQIIQALSMNHNLSGLKVKPHISQAMTHNHNQSGLKVKPHISQAMTHNHNQSGLKVKPHISQAMTYNHSQGELKLKPQKSDSMTYNHSQGLLKVKPQKSEAMSYNHNQGGLEVKPHLSEAMTVNHNQGGLTFKPIESRLQLRGRSFRAIMLAAVLISVITVATLGSPKTLLAAPPETTPIWRAQFRLVVADVSDAGTDDDVKVQLQDKNTTWLDYARDDYERNSTFTYDLRLNSLRRLSDITMLKIAKQGTNALCIRTMSLLINGRTIYTKDFGNSTCKWIDNNDGHPSSYTVSASTLRAHASWQGYVQPSVPTTMTRSELESRIEGAVGHRIKPNNLTWGSDFWNLFGRAVEVTKKPGTTRVVHVDLDLAYDIPGPNPEVDVDFDLTFECSDGRISVESDNYDAHLDSVIYDYLKSLLPGWGSNFLDELVNRHLKRLVSALRLSGQFGGECPTISVTDSGDVVFSQP